MSGRFGDTAPLPSEGREGPAEREGAAGSTLVPDDAPAQGGRIKVLYSAGWGRNGGTLLDRTLGEVEGFVSLGEFRMVWRKGLINNELCNCGAPFRECPFWRRVFERAFGGMEAVDPEAMHRLAESVDKTRHLPWLLLPWRPGRFQSRLDEYRRVLGRLYRAIHQESEGKVMVDSSRFAGTALVLRSLPEIELYTLHLVRDSRASCFSWQRKKRRLEVVGEVQYLKRYGIFESSFWWALRNLTVEALKRPGRYKFLRYEDFVEAPSNSLEELVTFLGEEGGELPIDDSRSIVFGESHTQSGNPDRFQRGPVEIRLDDEWRSGMTAGKKLLVTLLTFPLLLRYGYTLSATKAGGSRR